MAGSRFPSPGTSHADGNRVDDAAGHRVIKAAEAGTIVLPEHDYRVLKGWEQNPYGF